MTPWYSGPAHPASWELQPGAYLRHQLATLVLQLVLLLQYEPAEQLVLQPHAGHGAVHERHPGRQLRREVGVGQPGGDVQAETLGHFHLSLAQRHKHRASWMSALEPRDRAL